jgi:hypothetical protein
MGLYCNTNAVPSNEIEKEKCGLHQDPEGHYPFPGDLVNDPQSEKY